jgi:hypothetical protein
MYSAAFGAMFEGSMCGAGANVFAVWLYALSRCDKDGDVELGQKAVSLLIGCTEDDVMGAIEYLTSPDEDSRSDTERGARLKRTGKILYRIVNYDYYKRIASYEKKKEADRIRKNEKDAAERAMKQTKVAKGREASRIEIDRDREMDLEIEIEKEHHSPSGDERRGSIPFDSFWNLYPRRDNRKKSQTAWCNLTVANQQAAIAALPDHVAYWVADGRTRKTTPMPTTWINGERWNDEIDSLGRTRSAHADKWDAEGNPK